MLWKHRPYGCRMFDGLPSTCRVRNICTVMSESVVRVAKHQFGDLVEVDERPEARGTLRSLKNIDSLARMDGLWLLRDRNDL